MLDSSPLDATAGAFKIMKSPNLEIVLFITLLFGGCDVVVHKELRQPRTGEVMDCFEMYPGSLIDIRGDEAAARQKFEMCVNALKGRGFVVLDKADK